MIWPVLYTIGANQDKNEGMNLGGKRERERKREEGREGSGGGKDASGGHWRAVGDIAARCLICKRKSERDRERVEEKKRRKGKIEAVRGHLGGRQRAFGWPLWLSTGTNITLVVPFREHETGMITLVSGDFFKNPDYNEANNGCVGFIVVKVF